MARNKKEREIGSRSKKVYGASLKGDKKHIEPHVDRLETLSDEYLDDETQRFDQSVGSATQRAQQIHDNFEIGIGSRLDAMNSTAGAHELLAQALKEAQAEEKKKKTTPRTKAPRSSAQSTDELLLGSMPAPLTEEDILMMKGGGGFDPDLDDFEDMALGEDSLLLEEVAPTQLFETLQDEIEALADEYDEHSEELEAILDEVYREKEEEERQYQHAFANASPQTRAELQEITEVEERILDDFEEIEALEAWLSCPDEEVLADNARLPEEERRALEQELDEYLEEGQHHINEGADLSSDKAVLSQHEAVLHRISGLQKDDRPKHPTTLRERSASAPQNPTQPFAPTALRPRSQSAPIQPSVKSTQSLGKVVIEALKQLGRFLGGLFGKLKSRKDKIIKSESQKQTTRSASAPLSLGPQEPLEFHSKRPDSAPTIGGSHSAPGDPKPGPAPSQAPSHPIKPKAVKPVLSTTQLSELKDQIDALKQRRNALKERIESISLPKSELKGCVQQNQGVISSLKERLGTDMKEEKTLRKDLHTIKQALSKKLPPSKRTVLEHEKSLKLKKWGRLTKRIQQTKGQIAQLAAQTDALSSTDTVKSDVRQKLMAEYQKLDEAIKTSESRWEQAMEAQQSSKLSGPTPK